MRRLARDEWKVFLPDSHPGYLTWDEFESNQLTLRTNAHGYGWDRRRSVPREGVALLQGLAICGRCGDRMTVRYGVQHGHPVPIYTCQRRGIETATPICQQIPGAALDTAVSDLVLDTLTPAALDVAVEVFEELRAREAEIDRARRAHVARAREEAELAQQQFLLVRPEHRLVADALERQWNERLQALAQAEETYTRASRSATPAGTAEMKARVARLVHDLPNVWHDPRTPVRERKRMLRLLIDDVTLDRGDMLRLSVRWKGGATSVVERPLPRTAPDLRRTPTAIVECVRSLATEHTDGAIAQILNARWLRTGTGKPFTARGVQFVRHEYQITSYAAHLQQGGWLTAPQMAELLHVHPGTVKRFAREGVVRAVRGDDKDTILFEPPMGPLPTPHPGKRFRDRRQYPQLASHRQKGIQYEA